MEAGYLLVLGFTAWTLVLLFSIGALRIGLALSGKKPVNTFKPWGEDISPFANRLCRAHANCCENLPMLLGVVLVASMTNQMAVINPLAMIFLSLRVFQSIVHVLSTNVVAVLIRFLLFVGQLLLLVYWLYSLFMH